MTTDEYTDEEAVEYRLHNTTSARTWAQEFCDRFRVAEETGEWVEDAEGLMIAWFANAIETGRDHGIRQARETCRGPDGSNTCTLARFHEGECAEVSP